MSPWKPLPEGAVLHVREKLAVIADLHLGYEWARGRAGDQIPAHSLNEVLERLGRILDREIVETLVIAGDLVESPRYCRATERDLEEFGRFLRDREVRLIRLSGNHDRLGPHSPAELVVDDWVIAHGDKPVTAHKSITGHMHPIFKAQGLSARCILAGPTTFVLPAFSENAAGLNVAADMLPKGWRSRGLRVLVDGGDELLDFGSVDDLAVRLAELGRVASV